MYCLQTLKTQEFRTKDFVVRSAHSIEHQERKYCHQQKQIEIVLPTAMYEE